MFINISNKKSLIPALIGAGLSLFFIKSGFLSLLFLVPLGFLGYRYDYKTAWTAFFFAVLGNIILALGLFSSADTGTSGVVWEILYFTLMTGIFTWIVSPPPESAKLPLSVRLVGGSCLGALLITVIFIRIISSTDFLRYLDSVLNSFVDMQSSSNVVQNALLESITAEAVLETIIAVTVRGGSLVSCFLLFALSRQMSFGFARLFLIKKTKGALGTPGSVQDGSLLKSSLALFHVIPSMIWVFSASLLLVVLMRMINLVIPEIILWNILILCVILYLAQGLGIMQFFLMRPSTPPFMGLLAIVLFFILLFSPVLNLALLGGLTVLGIAENWVPFRMPKNGPPSTPEAGGGI